LAVGSWRMPEIVDERGSLSSTYSLRFSSLNSQL
jgi:hypothetical protein